MQKILKLSLVLALAFFTGYVSGYRSGDIHAPNQLLTAHHYKTATTILDEVDLIMDSYDVGSDHMGMASGDFESLIASLILKQSQCAIRIQWYNTTVGSKEYDTKRVEALGERHMKMVTDMIKIVQEHHHREADPFLSKELRGKLTQN